jgi:hypothetical protein
VFTSFSDRPSTLTSGEAGKTFLYSRTGNWHQWTGTAWKVLSDSAINVLDYGLTGLGIADESAAFTALLALNLGTKYYFPRGQYRFNSTQFLNVYTANDHRDAPQIIGDGIDSTVFINNVANGALFDYRQSAAQVAGFTFGYGLGFQDCTILGDGAANSDGISVSGAINPRFHRIRIRSVTGHGFVYPFDTRAPVEGSSPFQYYNADAFTNGFSDFAACTAELCGKWGWYIDTGNSAVNMDNCFASSCAGGGIYLQSGTSALSNCSFSYCGTFSDTKSAGIWLGDDYLNAKTGFLRYSYPTIFNCVLENIELDSNYNRLLFASGYGHKFTNIRLIQGSLPPVSGTFQNAPFMVQMGAGGYPLTDTVFDTVQFRTPPGTPTLASYGFADNLGYANNSSSGGTYCTNVRVLNLSDIHNNTPNKYYLFNTISTFTAEEGGRLAYSYPSGIPTAGTWKVGDKIYNVTPTPGGYEGWVCTTAGTPGTWKGFGLIQA